MRDRLEDIPLLAVALLARVAPQRRMALSASALAVLQRHRFPGDVRELRKVLERAALLADGTTIDPVHVERALGTDVPSTASLASGASGASGAGGVDAPSEQASLRSVACAQ